MTGVVATIGAVEVRREIENELLIGLGFRLRTLAGLLPGGRRTAMVSVVPSSCGSEDGRCP